MSVEFEGYEETLEDLQQMQEQFAGGNIMLAAMRDAALLVAREAKTLAPVDTGRLRASITPDAYKTRDGYEGVVGSNVLYAPYVEFGTRPHWPPPGALVPWAPRHGMSEGTARYIIGTRGTKAHPYLIPAVENNVQGIARILERAVDKVIKN